MRILNILFLILAPVILCGYFWSSSGRLATRVAELEAQVEELSAVLDFVYVETEEINGLAGPHWIIEGANVHVWSGFGATDDGCRSSAPDFPNCANLTGLGNLIVGYNERQLIAGQEPREARTGSHNLVVGKFHTYSSFAGFVAGDSNDITGASASISGGRNNGASGRLSSVSGGLRNLASGDAASVSGGEDREAPGDSNWAAGDLLEPN
jgi:hypothetical protein